MNPRISLIHDWIDAYGGAERVVEAIADVLQPDKFFTILANPQSELTQKLSPILHTSSLQKVPFAFFFHRYFLETYPRLIEGFNLSDSEIIFSSSHCVAKGALARSDQLHISYLHTPARYLWDQANEYLQINRIKGVKRWYVERVFSKLREWDVASSGRVDLYLANSQNVARRIWRCYRRPSLVVYPFVDMSRFVIPAVSQKKDYFVVLSRLVSQKRVDIAVAACSKAGIPLKVIGMGPEYKRLRAQANQFVEFCGSLSDSEIVKIVSESQGLLFTPEEDFGIVPLEAQALGTPVLAYGRGGALETVIEGKTGDFYWEQSVDALKGVLQKWEPDRYSRDDLLLNAKRFSKEKFCAQIAQIVREAWSSFSVKYEFRDEEFCRVARYTETKDFSKCGMQKEF